MSTEAIAAIIVLGIATLFFAIMYSMTSVKLTKAIIQLKSIYYDESNCDIIANMGSFTVF